MNYCYLCFDPVIPDCCTVSGCEIFKRLCHIICVFYSKCTKNNVILILKCSVASGYQNGGRLIRFTLASSMLVLVYGEDHALLVIFIRGSCKLGSLIDRLLKAGFTPTLLGIRNNTLPGAIEELRLQSLF